MKYYLVLLIIFLFSSCYSDDEFCGYSTEITDKISDNGDQIVLGEKLPNPYSLANMKNAYDKLAKTRSDVSDIAIEVTDLYVRFLPSDSAELRILQNDTSLELFDYPLDRDVISEGTYYHDPSLPEGAITWMYTTVAKDYKFPDIKYEILEECFIPAEGESDNEDEITRSKNADLFTDLEYMAFEHCGLSSVLDKKEAEAVTRASKQKPEGYIRVYDTETGQDVGVKGVKVRCNLLVKWASAYTDDNGYYKMNKSFRAGPCYTTVFENKKDFELWGGMLPVLTARYLMGFHSKRGYDRTFGKNASAWDMATINNAAYDYYNMCSEAGISAPPNNLKIWIWDGSSGSSAAMLRHVYHPFGINSSSAWGNFFANTLVGFPATLLSTLLKGVMPDVTIGTKGTDSFDITMMISHELAHASHFTQVGSKYWSKVISYVITYGTYGEMSDNNSGICGVSEMWAFAIGYIEAYEKYGTRLPNTYYQVAKDWWFKPHIIWDLYESGVLTKYEIYSCLTSDVESHNDLKEKMVKTYPSKAELITGKFEEYGF